MIKKVSAAKAEPAATADQGQIEAVKTLLLSEIAALPTEFNGVRVDAQGDAHKGGRTLQVTIQPLKLEL